MIAQSPNQLLAALPPMADILRYGEARAGTVEHLASLMPRIVVQAALALPYAARNLDAAAAGKLRSAILAADSAIQLAQLEADVVTGWRDALQALLRDGQATRLVAGTAARLYTHRHTVRYRLERVKDLTALDVSSTDGREKLGLGLKAMRVLGIASPQGPALEPGSKGGKVARGNSDE